MKSKYSISGLLLATFALSACNETNQNPLALTAQQAHFDVDTTAIVKRDDTVYSIAYSRGVSTKDLIAANNLQAPFTLTPGQFLKIPQGSGASSMAVADDMPVADIQPIHSKPIKTLLPLAPIVGSPAPITSVPVTSAAAPAAQTLQAPASALKPLAAVGSLAPLPTLPAVAKEEEKSSATLSDDLASELDSEITKPLKKEIKPHEAPVKKKAETSMPKKEEANSGENKKLLWPVRGKILAAYGAQVSGTRNDGINIEATKGAPVKAADEGTVVYAGNELKAFGNLVLIKHSNGWVTAYGFLDHIAVAKGDKVTRGAEIAKAGQSGQADKPQLHFELRRYMDKDKKKLKTVDPTSYLTH